MAVKSRSLMFDKGGARPRLRATNVCPACPYYGRTIVKYHGSLNAEIMFVGESPGNTELEKGKPFVGRSGVVLNKLIEHMGLSRSDVYVANACRCMLKKESKKVDNLALKYCRQYLEIAINKVRPRMIIVLGAYALQQVLGLQKIMSNRGNLFNAEDFNNTPVFVTVHPAYVLRGCSKGFPDIPFRQMNMKEKLIFQDFATARSIMKNKFKPVKIKTSNYKEATVSEIQRLVKGKDIVSIDYETVSADIFNPNNKIISLSFTVKSGESRVYIPNDGKLPMGIKKILSNGRIKKIVAARPFEERVTEKLGGGEIKGVVHDVLITAHLLDENSYQYNLESVANSYTELKNIKDLSEGMRGDMINAPRKTVVKYNGVDTDAQFRAYVAMKKDLERDPQLARYYLKITMPILNMFSDIVKNGCKIDTRKLKKNEEWASEELERLTKKAMRYVHDNIKKKFEPDLKLKDSVVREVLFTNRKGFKLRPHSDYITKKTRQPQVTEKHLKHFKGVPFVDIYLQWNKLEKIRNSYLQNMWRHIKPDGYVYPKTFLNRTVTGRTVMTEPAVQTIPQHEFKNEFYYLSKELFIAETGWYLCGRDLSQSELRIMGWLAGDRNMLEALDQRIDLHLRTGAVVSNSSIEKAIKNAKHKVMKDMRQKAKAVNFGFIYGMTAKGFQSYALDEYGLKLTIEECEIIRSMFFSRPDGYYALPVYHEKQKHEVREHGFVRSPLGRVRRLPNIYSDEWRDKAEAERQAINFPDQNFSSDLALIGMFLFHQEVQSNVRLKNNIKLMWFIHDADYFKAKDKYIVKGMELLKECMEVRSKEYIWKHFKVDVSYPIESDGSYGKRWTSMKDFRF